MASSIPWARTTRPQLGRGTQTDTGVAWGDVGTVTVPDGFAGEIVAISAGQLHGAFLTAAGEVYTWGDNNLGKLGLGTTSNYELLVPTKVTALDGVVISSIIMANGASYAISSDGVLYSWGQNTNGQLGIGSLTNTGTPTAISPAAFGGEKVVEVSSGTSFTLVRTESGDVYAMGGNVQGQLGKGDSGTATRSNIPVLVDVPGTVVKVIAGTNTPRSRSPTMARSGAGARPTTASSSRATSSMARSPTPTTQMCCCPRRSRACPATWSTPISARAGALR